jgi:hypothetical protein
MMSRPHSSRFAVSYTLGVLLTCTSGCTRSAPPEIAASSAPAPSASAAVDTDAELIERMRKAKVDLSKPISVVHHMYFPNKDAADETSILLGGYEYAVETRPPAQDKRQGDAGGPSWQVVATKEIVITPDSIHAARALLTNAAHLERGIYDGWEATPPKP